MKNLKAYWAGCMTMYFTVFCIFGSRSNAKGGDVVDGKENIAYENSPVKDERDVRRQILLRQQNSYVIGISSVRCVYVHLKY